MTIITPQGAAMTLQQAVAANLVQVTSEEDSTLIVADNHSPVTLKLTGRGLRVIATTIKEHKGNFGGNGTPEYFGPLNGTLTLAETGAVAHNGKRLKASRASRTPHTIVNVTRHGRRYVVRLSAKSTAGIAGICIRLGKAPSRRYSRPLTLTLKQLKSLRFDSVDDFGRWEPSRRAPVPR